MQETVSDVFIFLLFPSHYADMHQIGFYRIRKKNASS